MLWSGIQYFNGGGCGAALPTAMNLLCWHCRGLGNPQTEQELGDLIRAHSPSIVFVAETWLKKARLIYLCDKLEFDDMIEFSREGRGGGGCWFFGKKKWISRWILTRRIILMRSIIKGRRGSGDSLASMGNSKQTTIISLGPL